MWYCDRCTFLLYYHFRNSSNCHRNGTTDSKSCTFFLSSYEWQKVYMLMSTRMNPQDVYCFFKQPSLLRHIVWWMHRSMRHWLCERLYSLNKLVMQNSLKLIMQNVMQIVKNLLCKMVCTILTIVTAVYRISIIIQVYLVRDFFLLLLTFRQLWNFKWPRL